MNKLLQLRSLVDNGLPALLSTHLSTLPKQLWTTSAKQEIYAFVGEHMDDLARSPLRRLVEGELTSAVPFYYPKRHRAVLEDMLTVADIAYTMWREKRKNCKHLFEPDSSPGWVVCNKCGESRAATMRDKPNDAKTKRTGGRTKLRADQRPGVHKQPGERPEERASDPVLADGPE
jgi:hypothetical protein